MPYNTATFNFGEISSLYSANNLLILSSHVSIMESAFAPLVIFTGFKTCEMAFTPDASVRGLRFRLMRFHAHSPFPRHLRTVALASPVVRLRSTL